MSAERGDHSWLYKRCEPEGHRDQQPIHLGHECCAAQPDSELQPQFGPKLTSIRERELLCCTDDGRAEWADTDSGLLRTWLLRHRSGGIQKLPHNRVKEC